MSAVDWVKLAIATWWALMPPFLVDYIVPCAIILGLMLVLSLKGKGNAE